MHDWRLTDTHSIRQDERYGGGYNSNDAYRDYIFSDKRQLISAGPLREKRRCTGCHGPKQAGQFRHGLSVRSRHKVAPNTG